MAVTSLWAVRGNLGGGLNDGAKAEKTEWTKGRRDGKWL